MQFELKKERVINVVEFVNTLVESSRKWSVATEQDINVYNEYIYIPNHQNLIFECLKE